MVQVMLVGNVLGGHVLIWPTEASHWLNIKIIIQELIDRDHHVTILVSTASLFITSGDISAAKFEVYPVPFTKVDFDSLIMDIIKLWWNNKPTISTFHRQMCEAKYWGIWDSYYSQVLGRPTTLCETMGKAEIWLIRTYWDFEFPRPFLPNFEFVGGLHCQPAKPLPEEMEEFVQSSGEHGIVVLSLGSMVQNLTDEKNNIIASALSQLPQKVVWRYKGKKPDMLGANTRTYDWIPQNDLLGHPKTKAFITHGGTNGIYEAIYHGTPMVGIPLFADQTDNILHMKAKGMAVELDIHTMKTEDLVDAVNTVIHNALFKKNALRISQIHHDQPIRPLDRAVFWIEFVMRHKGAKHLRSAAYHLTWYQYHCLDVIAFLIGCTVAFAFIAFKCWSYCFWKCGNMLQKSKTD
ncbi:UDP-glucuronosyltransferase 2A2-like isoform X4 [Candoia aspera]|uniref:UDP-glucuronosyltransferase 2A2-like isoform X4 n=1 Tax=Candoia aspera TaxID=51853 RepID=UPI002FD7CE03